MDRDRTSTALAFAVIGVASEAAHHLADYGTGQTNRQAVSKAAPGYNPGDTPGDPKVSRARSWRYNLAHVAAYHATLVPAVGATLAATGVRIQPRRAAVAVGISAVSHAVIDRRWPVERFMKATGSAAFYPQGAESVDQALHRAFLWGAALYAARGARVA